MKRDPYNHEERYKNWKTKTINGIEEISKTNSDLIKKYIHDMEHGLNISIKNKKGGRSFIRLNSLIEKMTFFAKRFSKVYSIEDLRLINEENAIMFFSKMRNGEIARLDGKPYKGVGYFVKIFKAFWHWHMTLNRKLGETIPDITIDLDSRDEKPKWVYLDEEQFRKLCSYAKYEVKVLIMFLFDSGIRSPTELMNVKVSDLYKECKNDRRKPHPNHTSFKSSNSSNNTFTANINSNKNRRNKRKSHSLQVKNRRYFIWKTNFRRREI